jgi:hypothetical protein
MYDRREDAYGELSLFESPGEVEAVRAAGPSIGPIHTGIAPPPPDLRKGVPPDAVLSPLAITLRGLRSSKRALKKVSQIVVHMTGQGPATRSKESGYKKPAIDFALNWYLGGGPSGGYAHYVIDFPGTIYATSDERHVTYHAGWAHAGGAALFKNPNWRAPAWWQAVWGKYGFRSPLQLLPAGVTSPNSASIGIELLITTGRKFTDQQYRALARLIVDIERRHGLSIPAAPSPQLLGHEDYAPVVEKGRANKGGGWDPGAHRTDPYFSWSRLWSYMRGGAAVSTPESTPSFMAPQAAPTAAPQSGTLANSGLSVAERKALEITSTFETGRRGSFFGLTGNFDGQGISFGLVNWNIGTGSLQPLLRAFASEQPARWSAVFGPHAASFAALIAQTGKPAEAAQLRFAIDQMNASSVVNGKQRWTVREPWATYFKRLSDDTEFQRIQVRYVRDLFDRARYFCNYFGLKSERAFAFMFDAVSSHGKWWLTRKTNGVEQRRNLLRARLVDLEAKHGKGKIPEAELLLAIADVLAETSLARWRENVRNRKRWFVTGQHARAGELKGLTPRADVAY